MVYAIKNLISNKFYVGQTKRSFHKRYCGQFWWKHISNKYLEKDIKKYGHTNFKVFILKNKIKNKNLNYWEIYYINKLNCVYPNGYNLTSGGSYNSNYSFESRINMSISAGNNFSLKRWDGKIFTSNSIMLFSLEHDLPKDLIYRLINGYTKQSRGFALPDFPTEQITKPFYEIINDFGEVYIINNKHGFKDLAYDNDFIFFCNAHNLDSKRFYYNFLRKGGVKHYMKKWIKLEYAEEFKIIVRHDDGRTVSAYSLDAISKLTSIKKLYVHKLGSGSKIKGWECLKYYKIPDKKMENNSFGAKHYVFIKNNIKYNIFNLKKFCRQNNLSYYIMIDMIRGRRTNAYDYYLV